MPKVEETITVVDENLKILGWSLKLPFNLGRTERYQVLESVENGKTRSYIADYVPGVVGFFSHLFFKKAITHSFNDLNQGLKDVAEEIEKIRLHRK